MACDALRLACLNLITSLRWSEGGREEGIQLVVLRQTKLPQRRHINHPAHEFFHGQKFIDVLQHFGVISFLRVDLGIGIDVLHVVLIPGFLRRGGGVLRNIRSPEEDPRVVANDPAVAEQPHEHRAVLQLERALVITCVCEACCFKIERINNAQSAGISPSPNMSI